MFGLRIVKSDEIYKLKDSIFDLNYQNRDLQNDVNRLIRDNKELSDDCANLRNQNGFLIEKVNRLEIENKKLLDGTKQTQQQNMQQQALSTFVVPTRTQTRKEVYDYPSGGRVSTDNGNISAGDLYIAAIQSEAPTTKSKASSHSSSSDSLTSLSDSSSYSSYSSYSDNSSSSSCSSDSSSSSSCGGD